MKKGALILSIAVLGLLMSSCASKKDLENCQNANKELNDKFLDTKDQLTSTKEQLAVSNERVANLEQQLQEAKRDYARLQKSLDKSLTASNMTTMNISKLVDQINESNQYIRHLVEVKSKSDSLNMVLTNNLTRSLSK